MKVSAFLLPALSFFVPLVFLPLAEAHGILGGLTIGDTTYQGPTAGDQSTKDSPVLRISDASPVKGAMNKAITCGPDAKPASFVAPANPGDTVKALWTTNDHGHWPHDTGPMMVYLASCGSVTCDKFDAADAEWFKIAQVGRRTDSEWVQKDQFNGVPHTFKLPSNLAPGGYLLRHEIIALHLAQQQGGAEFYPACVQIDVGGSQSGIPSPSDLVKLPGAYKDNDPGILVDAYDSKQSYVFPGPPIAQFTSGTNGTTGSDGSDPNDDDTNNGANSPSSSPVPSSTGQIKTPAQPSPSVTPPKDGSGKCKSMKKKRVVYDGSDDPIPPFPAPAPVTLKGFKPRHTNSRVMARMAKPHNH